MVNPQLFVYWQLTGNGTPGAAFPTDITCDHDFPLFPNTQIILGNMKQMPILSLVIMIPNLET
jgi:hypothetical protein